MSIDLQIRQVAGVSVPSPGEQNLVFGTIFVSAPEL